MFLLKSEDLTHLGGRMGTEYTTTNYHKYFKTVEAAKAYAEKDYGKPIEWYTYGATITSGDLFYVMYDIFQVETED